MQFTLSASIVLFCASDVLELILIKQTPILFVQPKIDDRLQELHAHFYRLISCISFDLCINTPHLRLFPHHLEIIIKESILLILLLWIGRGDSNSNFFRW